ncbi:MAG: zinc ribbon domain-containing protein [Actinomycetota bacterium]|nr:zinc ribbon domain-containing protein [Actinomycetota bacterium]
MAPSQTTVPPQTRRDPVPLYEFRCRSCDRVFERRLSHQDRHQVTPCPEGHADTVRLLSRFSTARAQAVPALTPCGAPSPGGCGGGGCGGGACHAG